VDSVETIHRIRKVSAARGKVVGGNESHINFMILNTEFLVYAGAVALSTFIYIWGAFRLLPRLKTPSITRDKALALVWAILYVFSVVILHRIVYGNLNW
jgi:hypothetical protein